jgi:hypothetical protein
VDHAGASNSQLAKESPTLANIYKGRLVAEQHSLDLAWELLMDPCYADFNKEFSRQSQNCCAFDKSW